MLGAQQVPPPPAGRAELSEEPDAVPWSVLDALGVFLLSLILTVVLGGVLSAAVPQDAVPEAVMTAIYGPLTLALLGVTALAWVHVRYPGDARRLAGARPTGRDLLVGVGVGLATVIVLTVAIGLLLGAVLQLLGEEVPTVQQDLREMARNPATVPIFVLSALVVAPAFEELFFRGMVFPAIAKRLGLWAGIIGSALVFGVVHLNQAEDTLGAVLLLVRLVPLGALFAWLYHWRKTIVVPIVVHSMFNGASVVLFLLGME